MELSSYKVEEMGNGSEYFLCFALDQSGQNQWLVPPQHQLVSQLEKQLKLC